jgi:hypothetical protein
VIEPARVIGVAVGLSILGLALLGIVIASGVRLSPDVRDTLGVAILAVSEVAAFDLDRRHRRRRDLTHAIERHPSSKGRTTWRSKQNKHDEGGR